MNLDFTPEQEMIRDTYRRFCEKELTPEYVRWYDENCDYLPQDMYDKFATLGTQGLTIPEAYGGQGLGMTEFAIVLEEISRKSVAAAFCVGCGLAFGARPLLDMASRRRNVLFFISFSFNVDFSADYVDEKTIGHNMGVL